MSLSTLLRGATRVSRRGAVVISAAALWLCTGCAMDPADVDGLDGTAPGTHTEQVADPGVDVSLDAASGDDVVMVDQQRLGHRTFLLTAEEAGGEEQGPDPTPWEESRSEDADKLGPDPTPWRDSEDDDEDDDKYEGSADMGPDPTPWEPDDASAGTEPWGQTTDEDPSEPDPQPWEAHRTSSDGSAID